MAVPTFDRFFEPILRFLAQHPDGAAARDVHEAAAAALGLTDADRAQLLPSGTQTVYKNRAGWAHDRLKRSGLSVSLRRGFWQLTPAGRAFAVADPPPLGEDLIERLATEHNDVRLRPAETSGQPAPQPLAAPTIASPDDRLEAALAELRQTVAAELVEALSQVSPQYFRNHCSRSIEYLAQPQPCD
jgi:restriction system protein